MPTNPREVAQPPEILSQAPDTFANMETNAYIHQADLDEIALLASAGLQAELVFEGAGGQCPHCAALLFSEAA